MLVVILCNILDLIRYTYLNKAVFVVDGDLQCLASRAVLTIPLLCNRCAISKVITAAVTVISPEYCAVHCTVQSTVLSTVSVVTVNVCSKAERHSSMTGSRLRPLSYSTLEYAVTTSNYNRFTEVTDVSRWFLCIRMLWYKSFKGLLPENHQSYFPIE